MDSALKDKNFDFSVFFGVDVDRHTATAWHANEVETPRVFLRIYTGSQVRFGCLSYPRQQMKICLRGGSRCAKVCLGTDALRLFHLRYICEVALQHKCALNYK